MNEEPDTAPNERSITFEWDLPEAPEKVWRALTDAEIVSEWLGQNGLRPQQGAKFTVNDPWISEAPVECEVLAIEPERSIVFGWRDEAARRQGLASTVTFEIDAAQAGGTHLRIVHEVRHAAQPAATATLHTSAMAANDNRIGLRLAA